MNISINELIGNRATDMNQGDIIYEKIVEQIDSGNNVVLDFDGVQTILSIFLNNAIGKLYKNHTSEDLKNKLSITNMNNDDLFILQRVITRAKEFYEHPDEITQSLNTSIN